MCVQARNPALRFASLANVVFKEQLCRTCCLGFTVFITSCENALFILSDFMLISHHLSD